jgi:hypothetical protein
MTVTMRNLTWLASWRLFTSCRPAFGEEQVERAERTKLDEIELHELRLIPKAASPAGRAPLRAT